MDENSYTASDFMIAHDICAHLSKNKELDFKLQGNTLTRDEAQNHFDDRAALMRVRAILLDEGERIIS